MATLSYTRSSTVSVSGATATAKITLTITYSVSNANDRTTVSVSKLVVSDLTISSVSGGTAAAQASARYQALTILNRIVNNLVVETTLKGSTIATRTGVSPGTTYTSYTGSGYVTKTHSDQSVTLQLVNSSSKTTISVAAKPSYTISYNANGGSGAPGSQTKWYGETLTLTTSKPVKEGYIFKGWATSVANASAGTVNYASGASYTGNSAITLYAVWELAYTKPSITGVLVERCDANGNDDDEGGYAKVNFNWSVFQSSLARYYGGNTYPYANNTIDSASVTVGTETESFTASTALPIIVGSGNFSTDAQYDVGITITDSQTIATAHTTTVVGVLSTALYPIDVNADATAIGLLRPAPDNDTGLFVGGKVDVAGNINVTGDLNVDGTTTLSNARYIYGRNAADDNSLLLLGINGSNQILVGYGGRNNSVGATYLDGNVVNIRSNGALNVTATDTSFSGNISTTGQYKSLFKVTSVGVTVGTLNANSYKTGENYTMTAQSGYNAVGIVGWSTSHWRVRPTTNYINSNTQIFSGFANDTDTNVTSSVTITFRVLWLKATSA